MDVCSYCKVCQIFLSVDCAEIRDQVRTRVYVIFHTHHFWLFHVGILTMLKFLHLQAFELLCDLLVLYSPSPSSAHTTPALQTLVYLPSDSLRCDMAGFLIDYIFSDADSSDLNGQYLFYVKFLNEIWFVFQKLLHTITTMFLCFTIPV